MWNLNLRHFRKQSNVAFLHICSQYKCTYLWVIHALMRLSSELAAPQFPTRALTENIFGNASLQVQRKLPMLPGKANVFLMMNHGRFCHDIAVPLSPVDWDQPYCAKFPALFSLFTRVQKSRPGLVLTVVMWFPILYFYVTRCCCLVRVAVLSIHSNAPES